MTKTQEKVAWLMDHVIEATRMPKNRPWINGDDAWWIKSGRFVVRVKEWSPFADIAQAKMVQAAMFERGYTVALDAGAEWCVVKYQRYEPSGQRVVSGMALADTEAAAICEAAGRALGWPLEEEA